MKKIINSASSYSDAIAAIRELYQKHKYLIVSLRIGKDRSLDQNAISHCWYDAISKQLGENTPEGVKCECKLIYGLPILCAEDEDFAIMILAMLKNLTYEEQVKAMRYIDVTSLMSVHQMTRYLDSMQKEYAKQGVILEGLK